MHTVRFPLVIRTLTLLAALSSLAATGCKKAEVAKPAAPVAAPAPAADAGATANDPAVAAADAGPAAPSGKSEMTDPCPGPGEDAAACPKKPDTVEEKIKVAHVLVGWDGSLPGKKITRTKEEALKLAKEICHEARKPGSDFVALIWKYSGDGGPGVYELTPEARTRFMPEFTAMGLALGEGQVDVVATTYGYHVMKRVPFGFEPPEKPVVHVVTDACPGEGEDPAACPLAQNPSPTEAKVGLIVVGYQGAMRSRATRTQEEAKTLCIKLVHDARKKGADFFAVGEAVKGEMPGENMLDVKKDMPLPPAMKSLALNLGIGQVNAIETDFGYMIMKRIAPDFVKPEKPVEKVMTDACPADGEDKAACPTAQKDKPAEVDVTHILFAYAGAMRSTATRTKDEAKAAAIKACHEGRKKGADFNKVKDAAKSDDPGPGTYPVKPDSAMVPPFKALAFALGVGQIDIVESDFGYHVMKRNK